MIAVITNGREAEVGTHAELLQMKGIYFDLIQVNYNDIYSYSFYVAEAMSILLQSCKDESGIYDDVVAG